MSGFDDENRTDGDDPPDPEVRSALDRLYEVFGSVPRPARVAGCPHCVTPAEESRLLSAPVAELAPEVLARYAFKAITTWGEPADLRYFLPRLLECLLEAADEFPAEIVLGKLAAADWTTWPDPEVVAVEDFLYAWWRTTLDRYPSEPPADEVLAGIAATGLDLTECLRIWGRLESEAAVTHLHDLVTQRISWASPRRQNAYGDWAHQQLLAWLTRGDAATAVQDAFARETDEPVLAMLAETEPWVRTVPAVPLTGAAAQAFVTEAGARARHTAALQLARARWEGQARGKQPFDLDRLETLTETSRPGGVARRSERQAEYERMYYVNNPEMLTLQAFARQVDEINRWS